MNQLGKLTVQLYETISVIIFVFTILIIHIQSRMQARLLWNNWANTPEIKSVLNTRETSQVLFSFNFALNYSMEIKP